MFRSEEKNVVSITTQALISPNLQLDETAVYAVSLDAMPSLQWKYKAFSPPTHSCWSLPHGYLPKLKQVTLHPERPNALWILQRYGYGPCVYVQGNLLKDALAALPQDASLSQEDVLHGVVFYLAQHHAKAYVEPPNKTVYTCDDESTLNAHSFLENSAMALWAENQANALGMSYQAGVLQPLPQDAIPLISIVIPFRDAPALLKQVIDSLLAVKDDSPLFEIIGINNQSQDPQTLALMQSYAQNESIRFVDYDDSFNYAAMMNLGAEHASGELILQLNNDIEFITPNTLTQLASWAMLPTIGAVGATLFYPDGRIQHAGCHLGLWGHVGQLFRLRHLGDVPSAWSQVQRPVIAVLGAMLMIRKALYLELGGMNERDFKITYNEIDLCLKSHEKGYTNICLSSVQAVHYEGVTRKKTPNKIKHLQESSERQAFYTQYAHLLDNFDPTLSRGFDIMTDEGKPSTFLWKKPLKHRPLRGRLPFTSMRFSFTPWRFSLYPSSEASLPLLDDERAKEQSP
ncbi:MAG: glycosyltransferase family 2 protein [Vampirovibrionales bacterium]